METFNKYILPSILIFFGGLIGIYLTSRFNQQDWQERIVYEQHVKLFEQKLQLIERTTAITGKMPATNGLFNLYLFNITDTVEQNRLNKDQEIALTEKLGEVRAEFRSLMLLNQIYFGDSTRAKIQSYLNKDKKKAWWDIPEEQYNEIIETMSKEMNSNSIQSFSTSQQSSLQMSDQSKIIWTAIATLIGGIIIYVIGRAIEKFVLEPLQDYRKTLANISDNLIFYAHIYSNVNVASKEEKEEVSKALRKLASDLFVKTHQIFFYRLFFRFRTIPSFNNSIDASATLIGFSNSIWHSTPEEIIERREKIERLLRIKR